MYYLKWWTIHIFVETFVMKNMVAVESCDEPR